MLARTQGPDHSTSLFGPAMRSASPSKSVTAGRSRHMRRLASHQHALTLCTILDLPPTQRTYKFATLPPQQTHAKSPRKLAGRMGGGLVPTEPPPSGGTVAAPLPLTVWEQQRRIQAYVAQQLQLSEEEAGRRLQQLQQLLPGLQHQLHTMDRKDVVRLAADVTAVATRLLQLRAIFPGADAFKMAVREPFLVYGCTIFRLQRAAAELRRLLPGLDVDRLVEDQPSLLDVKTLRKAIKDFRRAEPSLDVQQALALDPSMPFRFSVGKPPNLSLAIGRRTALQVQGGSA